MYYNNPFNSSNKASNFINITSSEYDDLIKKINILGIIEERQNIESCNIKNIESWLDLLSKSKVAFKPIYLFSIDGYNDDSRELYEIPEVRKYAEALLSKCPHFLIFFEPTDISWFLLCACIKTQPELVNSGTRINLNVDVMKYKRIINTAIMYATANIPTIPNGKLEKFQQGMLEALN